MIHQSTPIAVTGCAKAKTKKTVRARMLATRQKRNEMPIRGDNLRDAAVVAILTDTARPDGQHPIRCKADRSRRFNERGCSPRWSKRSQSVVPRTSASDMCRALRRVEAHVL